MTETDLKPLKDTVARFADKAKQTTINVQLIEDIVSLAKDIESLDAGLQALDRRSKRTLFALYIASGLIFGLLVSGWF